MTNWYEMNSRLGSGWPVCIISNKCSYVFSNWGTENDDNAKYHNGNSDPRGFGKIMPAVRRLFVALVQQNWTLCRLAANFRDCWRPLQTILIQMSRHKMWGLFWDPNGLTFRLYISKCFGWKQQIFANFGRSNWKKKYY